MPEQIVLVVCCECLLAWGACVCGSSMHCTTSLPPLTRAPSPTQKNNARRLWPPRSAFLSQFTAVTQLTLTATSIPDSRERAATLQPLLQTLGTLPKLQELALTYAGAGACVPCVLGPWLGCGGRGVRALQVTSSQCHCHPVYPLVLPATFTY